MLNKVISAINKYGMFDYTEKVTVALSGGADSVCLLYCLRELGQRLGVEISAVHINHMLRGEESFRDEEFVKTLCEKLDIPLVVRRVDVNEIVGRTGESVELAARKARYEIFAEVAEGVVATAHTADDNLETVLFNMTRGSGLKGVCGIPPKRDIFVRPLIFCSRADVEAYLKEKGVSFVTDSSNLTDDYTRNFVRHNVVPQLRKINSGVEQTVCSMCANLREDEDFLYSTAKKIHALCFKEDYLDAELLCLQHESIIKRVIAIYLFEMFDIKTDSLHLEECKKILLCGGRTGLCKNMSANCQDGRFYVSDDLQTKELNIEFEVATKTVCIDEFTKINSLFLKNAVDCDKINGRLVVRTRMPSDEIRIKGRNCTKSLKKLFNEEKLSNELRDIVPIAADDSGVVWIYGIGVSERAAVDKNTKNAVMFNVREINKNLKSGDVKYD